MIVIASHPPNPSFEELLNQIREPFEEMVRREVLQAPLSLQKIQALLFLCMWPLPVEAQVGCTHPALGYEHLSLEHFADTALYAVERSELAILWYCCQFGFISGIA